MAVLTYVKKGGRVAPELTLTRLEVPPCARAPGGCARTREMPCPWCVFKKQLNVAVYHISCDLSCVEFICEDRLCEDRAVPVVWNYDWEWSSSTHGSRCPLRVGRGVAP